MRGWGCVAGAIALVGCGTLVGSSSDAPPADKPTSADAATSDAASDDAAPDAGNCAATPILEDHFARAGLMGDWGDSAGDTAKLTIDPTVGNAAPGSLRVALSSTAATLRQPLAAGSTCVHVSFALNVDGYTTSSSEAVTLFAINFDPKGDDRILLALFEDRSLQLVEQSVSGGKFDSRSAITLPGSGWVTVSVGYEAVSRTITLTGGATPFTDTAVLSHGALDSVWIGQIYGPSDAAGALHIDDFELR